MSNYMKKLDRFIIRKFLGTFAFALILILLIVVIFDISEKIDDFIVKQAPAKAIIFDYYLNFIPYFANLFSAMFIFIAVIFFTSKMAGNSEILNHHGHADERLLLLVGDFSGHLDAFLREQGRGAEDEPRQNGHCTH